MDQKKRCEICNRLYKIPPLEYPTFIPVTSRVYIMLKESDTTTIFSGDVCPNCAKELIWKIKTMKRNAPKKCDYCEFDRGPLYLEPQPECDNCIDNSNFQLKKRMTKTQKLGWAHYNGDLDTELKGE